jgi:hypothetical protein
VNFNPLPPLRNSKEFSMNTHSTGRRLLAIALIGIAWFGLANGALAADGTVRGKVQYEKILYRNPRTGAGGLQLDAPVLQPVAGAKVELLDANNTVLALGTTDLRGEYRLTWSAPQRAAARVRVLAAADNAVVVDHYNASQVYSVTSETWLLPEGEAVKDIVATDKGRLSGPFNIMAVIRIGNDLVRSVEPGLEFPHLKIHWTPRPRAGTSYFVPARNEAFILGFRGEDSDEFDDFIILHEYGHYLAKVFAKETSPGGIHGLGYKLNPRLAWSEGWATFFACAALDDPHYIDTGASRESDSGVRLEFNLDEARPNGDRAGYWSERTVASTLWAIHDKRPGKGHLGLGFAPIWKVLRGQSWQARSSYRHLVDYCDELVAARPDLGMRLAEVLAARNIAYTPGRTPSVADPYVQALPANVPQEGELDSRGPMGQNTLEATAVYTFTLMARTKVKLHLEIRGSKTPDKADLDLWLVGPDGMPIARSDRTNGVGGTETIEMELAPGSYFVEVRSWAWLNGGKLGQNTGSYRLKASY